MKKEKKFKKKRFNFKIMGAVAVVGVLILLLWGSYQINEYEDSVLSIYADQQDAYVQLVLDQINVQDNRTDEEIITEILSSLDTSNKKYWTLSKDQALLFVKDVMETNRYKGFTTSTYFVSESATEFLNQLVVNQVVHEIIDIDKEKYVASGVVFEYNGAQYKICLLTNETVILDNNTFLSSKIGLYIFIAIALCFLLLTAMILLWQLDDRDKRIEALVHREEELNSIVQSLEEKIEAFDYYHPRLSLFHRQLLKIFIQRMETRNIFPVTMMRVKFSGRKEMYGFLEAAQMLLDEKVIRFAWAEDTLILIFVKYTKEEARKAMKPLQSRDKNLQIQKVVSREDETKSLQEVYDVFQKAESEQK